VIHEATASSAKVQSEPASIPAPPGSSVALRARGVFEFFLESVKGQCTSRLSTWFHTRRFGPFRGMRDVNNFLQAEQMEHLTGTL